MGLSLAVGSFVNNDTVPLNGHTVRPPPAVSDRTEVCGLRIADADDRSAVIVGSAD